MLARLSRRRRLLLGYGLALFAAALYGGSSVIAKKTMGDFDIPPLVFTSYSLLLGVLLVFFIYHRSFDQFGGGVPRRYVGVMMIAGITSGSAITFLTLAVSRAPVSVVTPLASLNPLVTLTLAYVFLRRLERITLRVVGGTAMAVAGVILVVLGSAQL